MHFMHWFVDLVERNSIIFSIFFAMISSRLILSISFCDWTIILTNEWIFLCRFSDLINHWNFRINFTFWLNVSISFWNSFMSVEFSKMIVSISCIKNSRHVSSMCMIENWNFFFHAIWFWINWFAVFVLITVKIMKCLILDISAATIKTSWILIFLKTLFILFRYFMHLIWLIDVVEIMIIRRFFHVAFSSILTFFIMSVVLIFWIFLTVSRLTTCVHDFKFLIACLVVIIKTTKIIDDLIELKFRKISIDLNISWFDDFIWDDLMKLIINDFLKSCAAFAVSNLMINLNWFLMIIFNLVCIANNLIFLSIFTIFMFSSRSWLIWLTIDNMWKFSIIVYAFNIAVLVFCNLVLIFCLFKLNVNSKISFISSDLRFLIGFCLMKFFDVYVKFADVISINWSIDWLSV